MLWWSVFLGAKMLLWLINLVCGLTTATKSPAHLIYDTDICQSVVYLYLIRYSNMSKRCLSLSHTILTYVKASFISISYNTDICQSVVYLYLIRYWHMSKRRLSLSHRILAYVEALFISISYRNLPKFRFITFSSILQQH